jgi:hypothetical protein
VTSLLGVGSISIEGTIETSFLLYIVPIIAFAFDLYILGDDFCVKRAGGFLGNKKSMVSDAEVEWEKWVSKNRDPLTRVAGPILSLIVLFISGIILISKVDIITTFWIWLTISFILIVGLHTYSFFLNKRIHDHSYRHVI